MEIEGDKIVMIAVLCLALGIYLGYTFDRMSVNEQIERITTYLQTRCTWTISSQNLSVENLTWK